MTDAILLAARIAATGEVDRESAAWLADGIRRWWRLGDEASRLPAYLGLPATRGRAAIGVRDHWLRAAAEDLPPEDRGAHLRQAVLGFLRHRWHLWKGLAVPPAGSSALEECLFYAAQSGAEMRLSRRQYCNILGGK